MACAIQGIRERVALHPIHGIYEALGVSFFFSFFVFSSVGSWNNKGIHCLLFKSKDDFTFDRETDHI